MNNKDESEFGRGFLYNLILFTKHYERMREYRKMYEEMEKANPDLSRSDKGVGMWFNGASDHLYELEVPKRFKGKLIDSMVQELMSISMRNRLDEGTMEEFYRVHELVQKIAIELDTYFGVEVIEADFD